MPSANASARRLFVAATVAAAAVIAVAGGATATPQSTNLAATVADTETESVASATEPGRCVPTDSGREPVQTAVDRQTTSTNRSSEQPATTTDSVALGDVATVSVSVPAGRNATVEVATANGTRVSRHGVSDDGDGAVVLDIDTYAAASRRVDSARTVGVRGSDRVTGATSVNDTAMTVGEYAVTVRQNGTAVSTHQFSVTEPVIEGVTASRGATHVFDAANASEVHAAEAAGLIRENESGPVSVIEGETAVLRLDAPSLVGAFGARSTDRLIDPASGLDAASPQSGSK